ncbi:Regulatory protein [Actinidia chinensis var. chinensis]|uniref:Regulatory protein n=1 Tax=Actinidia chinensis var. chinensis TaxID=1590841 RepID=A0A2R6RML5_ACTCC|nr:Regulatory protein [Actinidia chinensis var. chinensis]
MSRCFPYPPPGYSAKNDRNEALIESIKLQKEREKTKAERKKERKREKKEKKRENKEKAKQNVSEFGHGEKRKLNDEKTTLKWEKEDQVDLEGMYIQKSREDEVEQLERSGLTEEHEHPVCPQNPSYSSDSSQNSNKRRRPSSPTSAISAHWNVIRIRLPSHKQRELDASVSQERGSSTSLRIESTSKNNSDIGGGSTQQEFSSKKTDICALGITPRFDNEQICSTSVGAGIFAEDNSGTNTRPTSFEIGIQTIQLLYKDLVEHWVPPHLQSEQTDLEEQEWLFKKHPNRERSKAKASSDVSCTGGSTLWPRAQYLSEADIYALPFAVPF